MPECNHVASLDRVISVSKPIHKEHVAGLQKRVHTTPNGDESTARKPRPGTAWEEPP
jgi:hypothetical protein